MRHGQAEFRIVPSPAPPFLDQGGSIQEPKEGAIARQLPEFVCSNAGIAFKESGFAILKRFFAKVYSEAPPVPRYRQFALKGALTRGPGCPLGGRQLVPSHLYAVPCSKEIYGLSEAQPTDALHKCDRVHVRTAREAVQTPAVE